MKKMKIPPYGHCFFGLVYAFYFAAALALVLAAICMIIKVRKKSKQ